MTNLVITRSGNRNTDETEGVDSTNLEMLERNIYEPYAQCRRELRRARTTKPIRQRRNMDSRKALTPPLAKPARDPGYYESTL